MASHISEFGSIVAAAIAAVVAVYGFFSPYFLALSPAASIAFAALLSFYFQNRIQTNTRTNEKLKLAVIESFSGVYSDLLQITKQLQLNKSACRFTIPNPQQWPSIQSSYRFFLMPSPLRDDIQKFFVRLVELSQIPLNEELLRIGRRLGTSLYNGSTSVDFPKFTFNLLAGRTFTLDNIDLALRLFWDSDLSVYGSVDSVMFPQADGPGLIGRKEGQEAATFLTSFEKSMKEAISKSKVTTTAKAEYTSIDQTATKLLEQVKKKISDWTSSK